MEFEFAIMARLSALLASPSRTLLGNWGQERERKNSLKGRSRSVREQWQGWKLADGSQSCVAGQTS